MFNALMSEEETCQVCDGSGKLLGKVCPLCAETETEEDDDESYEDGDEEVDEVDELEPLPPAVAQWACGTRVRCDRMCNNVFVAATITAVNSDATYNVAFKDGLIETEVPCTRLRSNKYRNKALGPGCTSASARSDKRHKPEGSESDWSPVIQAAHESIAWHADARGNAIRESSCDKEKSHCVNPQWGGGCAKVSGSAPLDVSADRGPILAFLQSLGKVQQPTAVA